jgi:cytochrome c556
MRVKHLVVTTALSLCLFAGAAMAQSAADALKDRKAGFQNTAGQMRAIKGVLDAKGPVAPIAVSAQTMAEYAVKIPGLFPKDSGTGDTKALPAIWTDFADFEAKAKAFETAAKNLQQVAASGADHAAVQAAYGALGATCGSCHEKFRAK